MLATPLVSSIVSISWQKGPVTGKLVWGTNFPWNFGEELGVARNVNFGTQVNTCNNESRIKFEDLSEIFTPR